MIRLWSLFFFAVLNTASLARAESPFHMRLMADPTTFDWNIAHTEMETPIIMNIMEGLFSFDSQMKVKPDLAKSYPASPDNRIYTFKIKNDVKWSDGKTLSANDFVYSWKRLLDPLTSAPYAYILFDIEGAEEFNSRKTTDFSKVGIRALDPFTLQVRLKKPVAYFLQMLTFWATFPVREDIVERYGVSWSQPGKTVVLGPFIPTSYQPQSQITLKRNELYHGPKPALANVTMHIINEDTTALNLFKNGKLDFMQHVNFLEMGKLKDTPSFHSSPYFRTCFINVNTAKYPFNLPKARQALALAINKSKIAQVLHEPVTPADSYIDPKLFPEGKGIGFAHDPEAAKKLLKEVGLDGNAIGPIELYGHASDETALLTQYLQDQLRKNLGLVVEIQMPEFKTFRTQLELGTAHLYFRCWGADYADPQSYMDVFLSSSGNNRTGWKNSYYDNLINKAAVSSAPERVRIYKEALDLLLRKNAVIIPLYHDSLTYLLNPKMKGFVINPLNYIYLKDVRRQG